MPKARVNGREVDLAPTMIDRAMLYLLPERGLRRLRHRFQVQALTGGYVTRGKRRQLGEWSVSHGDADADILPDVQELRELSADLARQNPIASGAIKTKLTSVIGPGLMLNATVDREFLGLDDAVADELELQFQREWSLFTTVECDVERQANFQQLTRMVYRGYLERGDSFALLPMFARPGSPYETKIQVIEADRVSNPRHTTDTDKIAGGIERNPATGEFVAVHIADRHPGNYRMADGGGKLGEWTRVQAYSASGRRNVLHVFDKQRPGQSRGVPDLAAVIEPLKQLGRYTEAEITAAVVAGMFTVFVTSEGGQTLQPIQPTEDSGATASDKDVKLISGGIVGLAPGEDVTAPNPGRPNQAFDPFVRAILAHVGMALEIPFEVLVKRFESSYSAARAAINEFWKYCLTQRSILRDTWCQPIYEIVIEEAVLRGRVAAPGFLRDEAVRRAYLGATWIGPGRGQINEVQEVEAAIQRYQHNFSTKAQETATLTGGDFETNVRVRRREKEAEESLDVVPPGAQTAPDPAANPQDSLDQPPKKGAA